VKWVFTFGLIGVIPFGVYDFNKINWEMSNDIILKIDNSRIEYFRDIENAVSSIPNRNIFVQVLRDDEILKLPITIGAVKKDGKETGVLGVSLGTNRSFAQSISIGVFKTYSYSEKTLQFIGKMITGDMGTDGLSGPIGIAEMAGKSAQRGFIDFMGLMALLSISLAVLNLLPIPVLDGGQLTLLGIEAVRGKPLPEKVENFIYTGGGVMVLALMIFAIFNDVSRFF
jgi:regulator of sigma E protease